jgi:hypothetical protein
MNKHAPLGTIILRLGIEREIPGHTGRILCGEWLELKLERGEWDDAVTDTMDGVDPNSRTTVEAYCMRMVAASMKARACN